MSFTRYGIKKPMSGIFWLLVVLLTVDLFTFTGCQTLTKALSRASAADRAPIPAVDKNKADDHKQDGRRVLLSISLVGDIMVHSDQLYSAYDRRTGKYSFTGVFTDVQPYLSSADLTIGNLETTLAGRNRGYTGYPKFNSPQEILPALREAGIDVLTNANNHAMDRGVYGVTETIRRLNLAGIKHTGTASSAGARSGLLIVDLKGIRVAILAYTYGTNGLPVPRGKSYLVNMLEMKQVREDIRKARESGADVVLVNPHFGVEYRRSPGAGEKKLVEELFEAGADIVAGSHPHVLQPMVRRDMAGDREGLFAAYSMGNFISSQLGPYRDSSVILNLKLEKDMETGKIRLAEADCIPIWVDRYKQNGRVMFRVVAVEKAIRDYERGLDRRLAPDDYARLKQVWQEITEVLSAPDSPSVRHV